ncbi:hypothetical protein I7I50_12065 [Histoplasma capsulatum G186AR]|uniref:Uncharacterized protein n=1 Tax=Ajellomyces capsulatus TaxID=5037 RepID=A0A8H8CS69_AJECA|nr:hypothetical protein I7I52_11623 [Histoplasma capsulatum]QSS70437.1 hypothetical protein I7I50_12065 [Histoplasma capsulatum G186AR]
MCKMACACRLGSAVRIRQIGDCKVWLQGVFGANLHFSKLPRSGRSPKARNTKRKKEREKGGMYYKFQTCTQLE